MLIAGGKTKDSNSTRSRRSFASVFVIAILIGEMKERISRSWSGAGLPDLGDSLEEAVERRP